MTEITVLGSGSRGNCLAIRSERQLLLVDAGFSAREIERRASAAALDLGELMAVALTHEHGDHAAGVAQLARRFAVPVVSSPGTWTALQTRRGRAAHFPLTMTARVELGPFRIEAALTSHDAAEPLALAVSTGDGRSVGIAYDLGRPTAAVRFLLRGRSALVLEANHDDVLLRTSGYPPAVQQRIAGAGGHLSNRAAAELLAELVHPALRVVVLAHLSERCNTEAQARATVEPALMSAGYAGVVHVARQGAPVGPYAVPAGGALELFA
ncbi:MAG TPA: MBL fold metallo-hydrolase [Gemmatimonadales bacterium]|nr:MBL fold metallo-hydrolase [Gemmatimonadales bacterium]